MRTKNPLRRNTLCVKDVGGTLQEKGQLRRNTLCTKVVGGPLYEMKKGLVENEYVL